MASNVFLVCSIFDVAAQEHGPLFLAPTLAVMWRNVDQLLDKATAPRAEFLAFVHGEFDTRSSKAPHQPYLEAVVYSCVDRGVLSVTAVEAVVGGLMVPEVSHG